MPARHRLSALIAALLVLSTVVIVHAPKSARAQAERGDRATSRAQGAVVVFGRAGAGLPPPVSDMRDAILEAVRTGNLESLRAAIELNELKPIIGEGAGDDPIADLRRLSADGEGRDVLAALEAILDAGWAAVPLGADIENNRIYVWPRFAATGTGSLSADERAELGRIVPADRLDANQQSGTYSYWRLGISADGTWHSFTR